MNRIKALRLARGYTQESVVAKMGSIITKQALSKYEQDKMTPSPTVAVKLARVLGIQAADLFTIPPFNVEFVAYRRHSGLTTKTQNQIQGSLAEEITRRHLLQEQLGLPNKFVLEPSPITSLEEAEEVANALRQLWLLGTDPIANLTDVLESRGVHVVRMASAPAKFHGVSAYLRSVDGRLYGAGVAYDGAAVGERQRFTLAHELGHLAMQVASTVDEEKAAHRFAGALLMPASEMYQSMGYIRHNVTLPELNLLKKRFGTSMQAILYRAKDLGILGAETVQQWFRYFSQQGWRTAEPNPLPIETPTQWEQLILRAIAEKVITPAEVARWDIVIEEETDSALSPVRAFLRHSPTERSRLLQVQAAEALESYADDMEREWLEADLTSSLNEEEEQ